MKNKIREVINLGEKVDNFIYPAEPNSNREKSKGQIQGTLLIPPKPNYLSNGLPLTCESLTQSDIINCNSRIVNTFISKAFVGL